MTDNCVMWLKKSKSVNQNIIQKYITIYEMIYDLLIYEMIALNW